MLHSSVTNNSSDCLSYIIRCSFHQTCHNFSPSVSSIPMSPWLQQVSLSRANPNNGGVSCLVYERSELDPSCFRTLCIIIFSRRIRTYTNRKRLTTDTNRIYELCRSGDITDSHCTNNCTLAVEYPMSDL